MESTVASEFTKIKDALRAEPKGLTIKDISERIGLNRNSTAKYMEMLLISGQVECRAVGTAKMYFAAMRIPIASVLGFTSSAILVLDANMIVSRMNDRFMEYTGCSQDDLLGRDARKETLLLSSDLGIINKTMDALDGSTYKGETALMTRKGERHFSIRIHPIVFEDGAKGAAVVLGDITEKKEYEKKLMHLASFPELNPNPVIETDDKLTNITYANRAANKEFPEIVSSGTGHPIFDGIGKPLGCNQRKGSKKMSREIAFGGVVYRQDVECIKDKGFIRIYMVDITERKRAEEALRRSEADLSRIFDTAPVAMAVIDRDQRVRRANHVAEALTGRKGREIDGLRWGEVLNCAHLPPGQKEREIGPHCESCSIRSAILGTIDDNKSFLGIDATLRRSRGGKVEDIFLRFSSIPFMTEEGGMALVAFEDVTERKEMESALRESEEKYRTLAENTSDVLWILDLDELKFRYVSPSVERLRGYTPEEVLAQDMTEVITEDSMERFMEGLPERMAEFEKEAAKYHLDEVEQLKKDGTTVWTEVSSKFTRNPKTGHIEVYGISRDISSRKPGRPKNG